MSKFIQIIILVITCIFYLTICSCGSVNSQYGKNSASPIAPKSITNTKDSVKSPSSYTDSFDELTTRYASWKTEGKTIREALCDLPDIKKVYAIDDYHTLIVPAITNSMSQFVTLRAYNEILALAKAYGGVLVRRKEYKDALTGKWKTVSKVIYIKNNAYGIEHLGVTKRPQYVDPDTKELKNLDLTTSDNYNWEHGEMKIVNTFTKTHTSFSGSITRLKGIILQHPKPQPFIYKGTFLPPPKQIIKVPHDGDIVSEEPIFTKANDTAGKMFKNILKNLALNDRIYDDKDILEYITVLCRNNIGRCQWVINKHDMLTEVSPVSAWSYILATPAVKSRWFMACRGNVKFAVKAVERDRYLYKNRDLSGINFKPLGSVPTSGDTEVKHEPIRIAQAGRNIDSIAQKLVQATVTSKTPITQIVGGVTRYVSSYNGMDTDGCVLISIIREADITPPEKYRQRDIYNYKVCNNQITSLGITPPQMLSESLIATLPRIAQGCQQYGEIKTSTSNYNIYCKALRDESQCKVRITVLRDNKLVKEFIYDGCTGQKLQ